MNKLVVNQEKGVSRKNKTYIDVKEEIDNAKPNRIEEERLLRHINKEITKQKEQEAEINKNFKSFKLKGEKGQELEAKIQKKEKELEKLKVEHSLKENIKKLKTSDDEFIDLNGAELKALLVKVQNERQITKKIMANEKVELAAQLTSLKENYSELSRQKNINSHRLQELNRLIKLNKDKARGEEQRNSSLGNEALTTKSQKLKSYQTKLRGELALSVLTKGSKTGKGHRANKSVADNLIIVDVVSIIATLGKRYTCTASFGFV
jgi:chromosome segregation ATPase